MSGARLLGETVNGSCQEALCDGAEMRGRQSPIAAPNRPGGHGSRPAARIPAAVGAPASPAPGQSSPPATWARADPGGKSPHSTPTRRVRDPRSGVAM